MKKVLGIILYTVMLFSLIGCGQSRENLISKVREYPVFSKNSGSEMRTVYDFEQKMENFNNEDSKFSIIVSTTYDTDPFNDKNSDSFIQKLQRTSGFIYDKNKHYIRLNVSYDFYSKKDKEIVYGQAYSYLFSLGKDEAVSSVACGTNSDNGYNVELESSLHLDIAMNSAMLGIQLAKDEIYNNLQ